MKNVIITNFECKNLKLECKLKHNYLQKDTKFANIIYKNTRNYDVSIKLNYYVIWNLYMEFRKYIFNNPLDTKFLYLLRNFVLKKNINRILKQ